MPPLTETANSGHPCTTKIMLAMTGLKLQQTLLVDATAVKSSTSGRPKIGDPNQVKRYWKGRYFKRRSFRT
jgi:hypothetical protein